MSAHYGELTTSEEVVHTLKDSIVGKNVLLIGATLNSLGGEFLRVLAPWPKTIWVAGRSKERLQLAVDEALKPLGTSDPKPTIHLVELDLTDFDSVRNAAQSINAQGEAIDVLFQNALVPWHTTLTRCKQGHEAQWSGNMLGPFLLVSLLLPRVRQAGRGARVVVVSSSVYEFAVPRWDDMDFIKRPEQYEKEGCYPLSKLANVLFIRELAKRLAAEGILAFSLNPGAVLTNGARAFGQETMKRYGIIAENGEVNPESPIKVKSLSEGAATYFVAAFDPTLADKSGAYLDDCQLVPEDQMAPTVTDENAKTLWALCEEQLAIKFL